MKLTSWAAFGLLAISACSSKDKTAAGDTSATAATPAAASAANADPDRNVSGGSIPAGFVARTDRANADISGAKYVASGDQWEVTTGPAHILYKPATVGNGNYTAS